MIRRITFTGLLIAILLSFVIAPALGAPASAEVGAYFAETGFRITNAAFLDFFNHRGRLRTFGYPVSHEFKLNGFKVQFFQRAIMQQLADGPVTTLNLLDAGLMPYTRINQAAFPAADPALLEKVPQPGSAGYNSAILAYIKDTVPDTWQSLPVNFYKTFMNTVSAADAFPDGKGDTALLPGFALEVWGVPTSAPAIDPNNGNFVYQRFQRGVMHYDKTTGTTQGLLLASYLKAIITGDGLPPDLNAQAKSSPLYRQYDSSKSGWIARPNDLPNSDLTRAFEPEATVVIDPGHGGFEIGSVGKFSDGTVLREKDVNLKVANRVTELLRKAGYRVIQTRTTDTSVSPVNKIIPSAAKLDIAADLQARIDIANNARASLFLSIHFNGHTNPNQRGTETYYSRGRPHYEQSLRFATLVQQKTVAALNSVGYATVSRGIKDDQKAVGTGNSFYLLGPNAVRPSTMPGALAEGLFLTNATDLAQLRDPRVIEATAGAYAAAVSEYLGPPPTSAQPGPATQTYTVAAGDTLGAIAARFNVSVATITQANDIADPSMIKVGQNLIIPGAQSPTPAAPIPTAQTYTVADGDTLGAIAARFNVSIAAIAQANDIADPFMIKVGQKLTIPGTQSPTPATPTQAAQTYTVAAGDTLGAIAARFNVSVATIAQVNDIADPSMIKVGQKLTIPAS